MFKNLKFVALGLACSFSSAIFAGIGQAYIELDPKTDAPAGFESLPFWKGYPGNDKDGFSSAPSLEAHHWQVYLMAKFADAIGKPAQKVIGRTNQGGSKYGLTISNLYTKGLPSTLGLSISSGATISMDEIVAFSKDGKLMIREDFYNKFAPATSRSSIKKTWKSGSNAGDRIFE